jgi:hypothetical protein
MWRINVFIATSSGKITPKSALFKKKNCYFPANGEVGAFTIRCNSFGDRDKKSIWILPLGGIKLAHLFSISK